MDTQVKYRLTGAIILVVIMVLVIPELLSGPSGAAAPAATTGEEAPLRSYTIDLSDNARTGALQATDPVGPQPGKLDTAPSAVPPAEEQQGAEVGDARSRDAEDEAPQEAAPIAGEGDVLEAPAPTSRPQAAPVPAAKPAATPTAAPRTPASSMPSSGWAVQVGSFASRNNAEKLARELQGRGFRSTVSRSSGSRKLYRVRVGPAPDRAGAQALLMRLKALGQSGAIVAYP